MVLILGLDRGRVSHGMKVILNVESLLFVGGPRGS